MRVQLLLRILSSTIPTYTTRINGLKNFRSKNCFSAKKRRLERRFCVEMAATGISDASVDVRPITGRRSPSVPAIPTA